MSAIETILKNPTYYDVFCYKGKLYQGVHEPIILKRLFDKVQEVMKRRGKPRKEKGLKPFVFRGMFKCGECGHSITADRKIRKSGREHVYYFCTKKSKTLSCRQSHFVREEELARQVKEIYQKVALKDEGVSNMLKQLEKDKKEIAHSYHPLAQDLRKELEAVEKT